MRAGILAAWWEIFVALRSPEIERRPLADGSEESRWSNVSRQSPGKT
jgi:hypothetical protein